MWPKRDEHELTIKETEKDIEQSNKDPNFRFTLDTNRIIILAQYNENFAFRELIGCDGYIITQTNIFELKYALKSPKYDQRTKTNMRVFLEHAEYKYKPIDYRKIKKELEPFTALIPRKLVRDIMIKLPDSYLRTLIHIYGHSVKELKNLENKFMKNSESYRRGEREIFEKARKKVEQEKTSIDKKIQDRYIELCNRFDEIDSRIDEKRYFSFVEMHKNQLIKEIDSILASNADFETLMRELEEYAKKTYGADLEFVAETVANAANGRSNDPDVITLFELHTASRVS